MEKQKSKQEVTKGLLIVRIIDWTLISIMIIAVILAQINGKYVNKEIEFVELCNGVPQNETQMEQLGYVRTTEVITNGMDEKKSYEGLFEQIKEHNRSR